jgi:hypothetical protein
MVRPGVQTMCAGLLGFGCLGGCAAAGTTQPRSVLYELASPDVGYAWHLHARDGELLCELPCERWIGERSGSYVALHDPKKSWRIDIPSALPAPPGSRVAMDVHVGKGSPALGTLGFALGLVGAAAASAGIGLLLAGYIHLEDPDGPSLFAAGGIMLGAGALLGVPGFWLTEHNRAPGVHVRVLANGLAGSF